MVVKLRLSEWWMCSSFLEILVFHGIRTDYCVIYIFSGEYVNHLHTVWHTCEIPFWQYLIILNWACVKEISLLLPASEILNTLVSLDLVQKTFCKSQSSRNSLHLSEKTEHLFPLQMVHCTKQNACNRALRSEEYTL